MPRLEQWLNDTSTNYLGRLDDFSTLSFVVFGKLRKESNISDKLAFFCDLATVMLSRLVVFSKSPSVILCI